MMDEYDYYLMRNMAIKSLTDDGVKIKTIAKAFCLEPQSVRHILREIEAEEKVKAYAHFGGR